MNLRKYVNLFYYNIFRFERFTQYLVATPIHGVLKLAGLGEAIAKRSGKENWEEYILSVLNDPKGGFSMNSTGNHVAILATLFLFTLLNLFCGLLRLSHDTFWFYGMIAMVIPAVLISNYAAPSNKKEYLKDFKNFESMSKAKKRKFALLTFLTVIGIWGMFIASFIYYMRSLIEP